MSSDALNKLTRYVSATTIVTADVANMWYGGLYGSSDASLYDSDHPIVAGHAHDGTRADGHAQKIHLVDHVTSKLEHQNLADEAVFKDNVFAWPSSEYKGDGITSNAIPHWETRPAPGGGTDKYYYIDLSMSDLGAFKEVENPAGDYSETDHIRTTNSNYSIGGWDFIFGSDSLDSIATLTEPDDGTNRFQFDRDTGSFRAGRASDTQWDHLLNGAASVAFGENNTARGGHSAALSGIGNLVSQDFSLVVGGESNSVDGVYSAVIGGLSNIILDTDKCGISFGESNLIERDASHSSIVGGAHNLISTESSGAAILGGAYNVIGLDNGYSSIVGGSYNEMHDDTKGWSVICGGMTNVVSNTWDEEARNNRFNIIGGGSYNQICGIYPEGDTPTWGPKSSLGGGHDIGILSGAYNKAEGDYTVISGGCYNKIANVAYEHVLEASKESTSKNVISGGAANEIEEVAAQSYGGMTISGGSGNKILTSPAASIVGGSYNTINGMGLFWDLDSAGVPHMNSHVVSTGNTILGGSHNIIDDNIHSYAVPGDPVASAGIMLGSTPGQSVAHGSFARAYIYNQIAHGGGIWDETEAGGGPAPYGQRQTSVIVVSTEISHGPHGVPTPSDDESALVKIYDDSQILTPVGRDLALADLEFPEDGVSAYASNFYARAITVPAHTIVSAKLTWVAVWNVDPSFASRVTRCVTGEMWGLFRMEEDSGAVVSIVEQGHTDRTKLGGAPGQGNPAGSLNQWSCEQLFEAFEPTPGVGYGIVYPRIRLDFKDSSGNWGSNDYSSYPIRISGRLEWTQVYQEKIL